MDPTAHAGRKAGVKLHPVVIDAQAKNVLWLVLIFRFINAICLQTFFQPDEYFQALEPAWEVAFGPGSGAWLTWEWQHQLRSSLHPVHLGLVYRATNELGTLARFPPALISVLLVVVPKVFQSLFAGLSDYYTWKLATKLYGHESNAPWAAVWMTVLNPWQWYCSTRTFSNSMETTLTIMALSYWPWEETFGDAQETEGKPLQEAFFVRSLRLSLDSAAIAVLLRPTNLLIWLSVLTLALTRMTLDGKSPFQGQSLALLFREVVFCGTSALAFSLVTDRIYFGMWTFPPYKWLYFNVSQSLAVFYGEMPWHYYLSQGIPLLTTTFLPFVLVGLYKATSSTQGWSVLQSNTHRVLSFAVLAMVASLSVISHKEVRFIYPLLPILHILAAPYITAFFVAPPGDSPKTDKPDPNPYASPFEPIKLRHKLFLANLLSVNVILAVYLSLFHQAAPLGAVRFLRNEFERLHPDALQLPSFARHWLSNTTVPVPIPVPVPVPAVADVVVEDELFALFLTPCHSTPWRSHLVWPTLRARALTCEPPLHTEPGSAARAAYRDEADHFFDDGPRFLREELWPWARLDADDEDDVGKDMPRYIVGFEGIEPLLQAFFAEELMGKTGEGGVGQLGLRRVWEGWNGLFHDDWRRQGKLVIWDTGAYLDTGAGEHDGF